MTKFLDILGVLGSVVTPWLVFFEKDLSKIATLDRKTCKKETMKGKLGGNSITSSWYKINKCTLRNVMQSESCNNSRFRSRLCCCKNAKVVYFKWTVLGFVSEISIFLFTRKLCFIKFCSTTLATYRKLMFR